MLRAHFLSFAVAALAPHAAAQCLEPSTAFHAGAFDGLVSDLATFDFGNGLELIACGVFTRASGGPADSMARWDGDRWRPLPYAVDGDVFVMETRLEGGVPVLYAGGAFSSINGISAGGLARFSQGSWSSLGGPISGRVGSIAFVDLGFGPEMYVGGTFQSVGPVTSPNIARYSNGTWSTIGGAVGSGSTSVLGLQAFDDGSGPALYVCGTFTQAGGTSHPYLARWNGVAWSSVGAMNGVVRALEIYDDGSGAKLVAAGSFNSAGGVAAQKVAQWNGVAWSPLGTGVAGTTSFIGRLEVLDVASGPPELIAIGDLSSVGGVPVSHIARWNGSLWSALGSGLPAVGRALHVHDGGGGPRIVAACGEFGSSSVPPFGTAFRWDRPAWNELDPGTAPEGGAVRAIASFTSLGEDELYVAGEFLEVGTPERRHLARWNGTHWRDVGGGANGPVRALTTYDDGSGPKLLAGGSFTTIGGVASRALALWDGDAWSAFPGFAALQFFGVPSIDSIAQHDDGSGPALYVCGTLHETALGARDVMRFRNGAWEAVGDPGDTYPTELVVHDDGTGPALYVAGFHQLSGPPFAARVYRWDGASWSQVGGNFRGPADYGSIFELASFDDGSGSALYVAGEITTHDGAPIANVARWRNGAWTGVGAGVVGRVSSLAVVDDGSGAGEQLWMGGEFTQIVGGALAKGLARWDGTTWSALPGVGNAPFAPVFPRASVQALATWNDGAGRDVYLGGRFENAAGVVSTNFARYEGCGETGRTFCYGDGSASACPCGNASAVGERAGCLHSLGSGGALRGRGEASIADDTLVLDGATMPESSALYFQGAGLAGGGFGVPFGDGIKCTSGPFIRLGAKVNASGASHYPEASDVTIAIKGQVGSGVTLRYQVRYRNAATFCSSETFNYTNGVEVVWRP